MPSVTRPDVRRAVLSVASLAAASGLLVVALPRFLQVGWPEIGRSLAGVSAGVLTALVVVWIGSLWAYTFVTTAALPGASHGQAFALNAVGGAMSNLLPFGGTAGALLGYAMARSWGHGRTSVVTATVVSNTCNVVGRLMLPVLGLGGLLLSGRSGGALTIAAVVAATVCLLIAGTLGAVVWSDRVGAALGRILDAAARRVVPGRFRPEARTTAEVLHTLRTQAGGVVERRWPRLGAGMAATFVLQALLFAGCLQAVSVHAPAVGILAAFAASRALTTLVVTPNGIGVSETGTAAVLVAVGTPAAPTAAAVLLFGLITHVLEIAIGVLAATVWAAGRAAQRRSAPDGR